MRTFSRLVFVMSVLTPLFSLGQFTYTVDQSVPVIVSEELIDMPWGGGLNTAQYNTIDLNGDGVDDIAIFDRTANKIVTYLRIGNSWNYSPEYETYFPTGLTNWVLLRDFNCDGKKDIFTSDVLGIRVYENITEPGGELAWKKVLFYSPVSLLKSPVLLTKGFSGKINLQLSADDLPSISDIDGDGDLDIFCPKYPGGTSFEFHKNYGVERYGTCDSLDFERVTQNWGDVYECTCGNFSFGSPCPPEIGGRVQHTAGKAILALDLNGDGATELIFSEDDCPQLYALHNTGTNDTPIVTSSSQFPNPNPAFIVQYPVSYFEDADFDGVKDLIVSPNFSRRTYFQSNLQSSLLLYKNFGTNENPSFTLTKNNHLQDEMIDVGDNAVPAFFDADGDGDFDLFLGYLTRNFSASLAYYENIGSANQPSYKLITDDFVGISFSNLFNIKPSFIDINGDTKVDLVFTASSLINGASYLYYILNASGIGLSLDAQSVEALNINDLNLLQSESICLTDVDGDGKPDILIGRQNGSLQYWRNVGTGLASFILEDGEFLGLGESLDRRSLVLSVGDLDADKTKDLIIADQNGVITIIGNYREADDISRGITDIVFNTKAGVYQTRNLGGKVWPTVANIFKTDKPSIVVGNILGGLQVLRNDEGKSLPDRPIIDIYPNPISVASQQKLYIRIDRPSALLVYSVLGQEMGDPIYLQAYQEYEFTTSPNHKGIFIFRFVINGNSYSRRVVIR